MKSQLKVLTRSMLAAMVCTAGSVEGQVTVTDNFTGATNQQPWTVFGGACLTAGTSSSTANGAIPMCSPTSSTNGTGEGGYGAGPCANGTTHSSGCFSAGVNDPVNSSGTGGNGALRLTNSQTNLAGAIVWKSTFPSTAGISITFNAVSYDGDSQNGDGADGLSFFLLDASIPAANINTGSDGGSLGYSCSDTNSNGNLNIGYGVGVNTAYTGITGGYVGLGIDEFGNFLNGGDNTATGVTAPNGSGVGTTVARGSSVQHPQRVGLRGIGAVNWYQLNANFPSFYPGSISTSAVLNTCESGTVWNYSGSTISNVSTGNVSGCAVGSTSCSSTVGNVSNGHNMNCAVLVNSVPVTYSQLTTANSTYYPSSLSTSAQTAAVVSTCGTGTMWNYSNSSSPVNTWTVVSNVPGAPGYVANSQTLYDYIPLANANLAFTETLANESAGARGNATMRTYNLKITSSGLLTLTYADDSPTTGVPGTAIPVLTNSPIFSANGPLPANFTFGFAGSTGGSVNVHEITCFQAAPADTSESSAGVNVVQTGQVKTGTQIYLAFYHASDWWGQLTSQNLVYNSSTNSVTVQAVANWDSSCDLTGDTSGTTLPGGDCQATGSSSDAAQSATYSATSRQIFTYDAVNNAGVALEWPGTSGATSNLNSTQQGWLNAGDSNGQKRLNYLRGDRSNEIAVNTTTGAVTGIFRTRIGVLGDVVDSSPTWVGAPLSPFPSGAGVTATAWQDLLNPTLSMPENTNTYGAYQSANVGRLNMVFVGANDGMMHGFEAGAFNSAGTFVTTYNDGKEVIGYMPNAVLNTIHNSGTVSLDYSSSNYAHNYYVDATPATGDLYFGGAWHNWLVSGLGAGGNALFALDITNPATTAATPSSPAFPESNASSIVIGEWSSATTGLGNNLGQTYGTPLINRLHSGNWAIIFGNGYNAPSYNGGVFVGLVNPTSGAVTFEFLPLPASANGTSAKPNGIFYVYTADLDGDDIIDYIYAGDLYGNVWRWDVTQTYSTVPSPATWAAAVPAPILLFQTPSGQPISTQVQAVSVAGTGTRPRVMVEFGTGEQINSPNSTTYAIGQQALYGIWDGNMASWNSKPTTTTANQFAVFPTTGGGVLSTQPTVPNTIGAGGLELQADTSATTTNIRVVGKNTVCWANGLATCATYPQYGWVYDFPLPSGMSTTTAASSVLEQVIFNPVVQNGAFVVNTYIAASSQACTTTNPTGWTMALNPATGGEFNTSFFGSSTGYGSTGGNSTNVVASGLNLGASGSPSFVVANSVSYLITQALGAAAPGSAQAATQAAALAAAQAALLAAQALLATDAANLAAAQAQLANDIAAGAPAATISSDNSNVASAQATYNAQAAIVASDTAQVAQDSFSQNPTPVVSQDGLGYRLNWTELR